MLAATIRNRGRSPTFSGLLLLGFTCQWSRLRFLVGYYFLLALLIGLSACRPLPLIVRSHSDFQPAVISPDQTVSTQRSLKASTNRRPLSFHLIAEMGTTGQGAGEFLYPTDLDVDLSGLIYVADTGNNRIQVLTSGGDFQAEFGHHGWQIGEFDGPNDVVIGQSTFFLADTGNDRVQICQMIDHLLTPFGQASSQGQSQSAFSWLDRPTGIDLSTGGEVYLVDQGHHRILKFDPNGQLLFAHGRYGDGVDQFRQPIDLAVDRQGNYYVVDAGNSKIKKYDFSGNFILEWDHHLQQPNRIAAHGRVYVTDSRSVKVFTIEGQYLTSFGHFEYPSGIATLDDQYLYVSDLLQNTISVFEVRQAKAELR